MPARPISFAYVGATADFERYDGQLHRVRLTRSFELPPLVPRRGGHALWIMCNPSDADDANDDMTITKCRGFCACWGFGSMVIHNRYTLVATDAERLGAAIAAGYPVEADADNAQRIASDVQGAGIVVFAWGDPPGARLDLGQVEAWCRSFVPDDLVHVIGLTSLGIPRHPSRAGYVAQPTPWPAKPPSPCRCNGTGLVDVWTGRAFRQEVCTCRFGWHPLPG